LITLHISTHFLYKITKQNTVLHCVEVRKNVDFCQGC